MQSRKQYFHTVITTCNYSCDYCAKVTQVERSLAQRLTGTIYSLINCYQFDCEDDSTLDLVNNLSDYYNEDRIIECGDNQNDTDEEWYDKENVKENYHLNNYSIEFMKNVIDFVDVNDSNGKRYRLWKAAKHRYQSIPDQAYISRFRNYLSHEGTKRQKKTQKGDKIVYDTFLKARELYLRIHDIGIQR
ncbi:unnamed protein product [Rotaria socialis]|uniref:Uncharacterized protein n=1 Tax=Rotaria socialis TaxID=392032 RepID=A0A821W5D2_9BILA|nr:unnamed protein product [Rotaria socialis]